MRIRTEHCLIISLLLCVSVCVHSKNFLEPSRNLKSKKSSKKSSKRSKKSKYTATPTEVPTISLPRDTGDRHCTNIATQFEESFHGSWQVRDLPAGTKCCPSLNRENNIIIQLLNLDCPSNPEAPSQTSIPTRAPTDKPTPETHVPTRAPTREPTKAPSNRPTQSPSKGPQQPTITPTLQEREPTQSPSKIDEPTKSPSEGQQPSQEKEPTKAPSKIDHYLRVSRLAPRARTRGDESKRCEKKEVEESSKFRRNGGDFHVQIYERNKKREKREDF